MYKFILLAVVLVQISATSVPYPGKSYTKEPAYKDEEPVPPQPYSFGYAVKDEYDDFSRQETSDGKVITGTYHVVLPDGRKQTVTYTADPVLGFSADVKYEGEPKYPEYIPQRDYSKSSTKESYGAPPSPSYPRKS